MYNIKYFYVSLVVQLFSYIFLSKNKIALRQEDTMTEESRLQLFRKLRSNIRGSEIYLVVGVDVAKDRHHAFFGTSKGKTLWSNLVFDNSKKGYDSLRNLVDNIKVKHGLEEVVYGVEPTSTYHKPFAEYLIRHNETVVLVSNVAVKRNRELLDGRWDKNDKKDAANVADLIGQGRCLYYEMPEKELRELRCLLAYRIKLKKLEHGLRMRIRNQIFAQYFPELDRLYMQKGQPDDMVLAIAEHCLDPREIAGMEFDTFMKLIVSRKIRIEQQRRLRAIWEAAKQTAGCLVQEAAKWEARSLVEQLKAMQAMVKENERQLAEHAKRFAEYKCLLSIPGFGPILSAMVLGAIGNATRFDNRRQVLRLAGLDLCACRSGKKTDNAVPVISKQGKAALRYALVQAAIVAARANPAVRSYFCRLIKGRQCERGINLKMKVKLAAKLLVVAWTLMKRKEQFNPSCFAA